MMRQKWKPVRSARRPVGRGSRGSGPVCRLDGSTIRRGAGGASGPPRQPATAGGKSEKTSRCNTSPKKMFRRGVGAVQRLNYGVSHIAMRTRSPQNQTCDIGQGRSNKSETLGGGKNGYATVHSFPGNRWPRIQPSAIEPEPLNPHSRIRNRSQPNSLPVNSLVFPQTFGAEWAFANFEILDLWFMYLYFGIYLILCICILYLYFYILFFIFYIIIYFEFYICICIYVHVFVAPTNTMCCHYEWLVVDYWYWCYW